MKLTDYLNPEQILLDFDGPSKEEGLKAVAQVLASHPTSASVGQQLIYEALNARENLGSTGIGDGIAIPHAKLPHIDSMVACFARSRDSRSRAAASSAILRNSKAARCSARIAASAAAVRSR